MDGAPVHGLRGVMYTQTLILTAAHCVSDLGTGPNTSVTVTWGVTDLEDPERTTRTSDYIHVADGYYGRGLAVSYPGPRTGTFGTAVAPVNHTVSGGTTPYSWSATGLPPGLSINSSTDSSSPTRTGRSLYSWTVSPAPVTGCVGVVDRDVAIPDASTVDSALAVSGCAGMASAQATVQLHILHPSVNELVVTLVAPDGSAYVLHNRELGAAGGIHQTYVVNPSSEVADGTWKLRVQDVYAGDRGTIDSWA